MGTGKAIQAAGEQQSPSIFPKASETEALLLKIIKTVNIKKNTLQEYFPAFMDALEPVWPFPFSFSLKIVYKKTEVLSGSFRNQSRTIREDLFIRDKKTGYIEIGLPQHTSQDAGVFWEEKIQTFLKTIIPVLENGIEQINTAAAIRKLSFKLNEKKTELEKKNLALKEILNQIENEKNALKEQIQSNLKKLILPVINKLKSVALSEETRNHYMETLESNFQRITADFTNKTGNQEDKLSPRELEICNMIINGYHSKEIAQMLQISLLTVERHRFNIRRKMGIRKHQVNLQNFLRKSGNSR